jgi:hypothetical protein
MRPKGCAAVCVTGIAARRIIECTIVEMNYSLVRWIPLALVAANYRLVEFSCDCAG